MVAGAAEVGDHGGQGRRHDGLVEGGQQHAEDNGEEDEVALPKARWSEVRHVGRFQVWAGLLANASVIASQNAGRSAGERLVMRLPSIHTV